MGDLLLLPCKASKRYLLDERPSECGAKVFDGYGWRGVAGFRSDGRCKYINARRRPDTCVTPAFFR